MTNAQDNKFSVNIYDVFANFVPGVVLIAGIFLPFWRSDMMSDIGVLEGTFMGLVVFAIGGGIQAIGSRIKRYQFPPFPSKDNENNNTLSENINSTPSFREGHIPAHGMERPSQQDLIEERISDDELEQRSQQDTNDTSFRRKCRRRIVRKRVLPFNERMEELKTGDEDLPLVEKEFFNSCSEVFEVDQETEEALYDWGYLFKMIIAYLETSPCNRTLRIQAQHLAARGLYVAFFLLSLWYLLIGGLDYFVGFGNISPDHLIRLSVLNDITGPLPKASIWWFLALLWIGIARLFYIRSVHFEEDVVKYMMSEMYILSNYDDRM